MPDTTWSIETKSNGIITADALTADWPTVTRGSRARLRLWFDESTAANSTPLVVGGGESVTVAEDQTVQYVSVEDNGTLTVADNTTLTVEEGGMWSILQYLDYADAAAYGVGINNRPWFRNQLPNIATQPNYWTDIESLVLGFQPSTDIRDRGITGLWGLVTGGEDRRNSTLTNWQVEVEVFVLGEYAEFSGHTDIENKLQA